MIIAQAPAQTPSRLLAAAQAEALAMLIGGGVAEARVTALEPGEPLASSWMGSR